MAKKNFLFLLHSLNMIENITFGFKNPLYSHFYEFSFDFSFPNRISSHANLVWKMFMEPIKNWFEIEFNLQNVWSVGNWEDSRWKTAQKFLKNIFFFDKLPPRWHNKLIFATWNFHYYKFCDGNKAIRLTALSRQFTVQLVFYTENRFFWDWIPWIDIGSCFRDDEKLWFHLLNEVLIVDFNFFGGIEWDCGGF